MEAIFAGVVETEETRQGLMTETGTTTGSGTESVTGMTAGIVTKIVTEIEVTLR